MFSIRLWQAQNLHDRLCDIEFFIRANDPHRCHAFTGRDHRSAGIIAPGIEFDPKKIETLANTGANDGHVFTYATGENDRVHSPERRGESTDPFLCLITEE